VSSALLIFVSQRSSAFLRVIRLIAFETQITAVLHAGSPFFFATIFVASACVLTTDQNQEDHCWGLKV
jgi:hypothetical protein